MSRLRELAQDIRAILRPPGPSSKYITYFQLLDAFKQEGCPVCARLEEGAAKALDGLMYEQVNDPITRDRLLESHGFCNWHAWMLPSIQNSALGVALIYRHLLEETLTHLQGAAGAIRPRGRWRRVAGRLLGFKEQPLPILDWRRGKTRCYLCTFAQRAESDDLKTLLDFLGEAEFAEAFGNSSGLCLPHLCAAMRIGRDHPQLPALIALHHARWKDLLWELEEFARKFDYRYADEAKGRESSSWHRVLELFVGRVGVFGPERAEGPISSAPPPALPVPAETAPAPAADAGWQAEVESLRFENEKLHRRIEELLGRREDDRRTRQALEFQVLKLRADLKALALDLAAARRGRPGRPRGAGRPATEGGERA